MATISDTFQLSKWFIEVCSTSARKNEQQNDKDEILSISSTNSDIECPANGTNQCKVCYAPNPGFQSTNAFETRAPSVPVCSLECETKYLQDMGVLMSDKDKQKQDKKRKRHEMEIVAPDYDVNNCYICHMPNPEYMSTNVVKNAPSVPVCGLECEGEYLRQCGMRAANETNPNNKNGSKDSSASTPIKSNRKSNSLVVIVGSDTEEEDQSTSQQQSNSQNAIDTVSWKYLNTQLEQLRAKYELGVQSWWIGALEFYEFCFQRHGMWYFYSMGLENPNVDPHLVKYWTCNIYRELDRSTTYIRRHALYWQAAHQGRLSLREILWMSVCFRLCNRIETFEKMKGIPRSDHFNRFAQGLQKMAKRPTGTDDNLMAGHVNRPKLTVNSYLSILKDFLVNLDEITIQVRSTVSISDLFQVLKDFKDNALGSYTCWQVVCDLQELNILHQDVILDDFVWLSKDAKRAIAYIFGEQRIRENKYTQLAQLLHSRQSQAFNALGVTFPYLLQQKINLKNIGHALHGFYQYIKMKAVSKREFNPEKMGSPPNTYNSRSYLMDVETCATCRRAEAENELVLCDLCNRMFHRNCLGMDALPPASWVCEECKKLLDIPVVGEISNKNMS